MDYTEKFHKACNNIIANKDAKALNWCVGYAKHGLTCVSRYEIHVQTLYILSNMTHWRGDVAKETRELLKAVERATK